MYFLFLKDLNSSFKKIKGSYQVWVFNLFWKISTTTKVWRAMEINNSLGILPLIILHHSDSVITNSQVTIVLLMPPSRSHYPDYYEVNPNHHIVLSVNISVYACKRKGCFCAFLETIKLSVSCFHPQNKLSYVHKGEWDIIHKTDFGDSVKFS